MLPDDLTSLDSESPLRRQWLASRDCPDFESIFIQAARLIRGQILSAKGSGSEWSRICGDPHEKFGIFSGLAGIAVFLAASSRLDQLHAGRDLAEQIAEEIRDAPLPEGRPLGLASGLASRIYTLVVLSESLDRPDFLERAFALTSELTPESIGRDTELDLLLGTSGILVALERLLRSGARSGVDESLCGGPIGLLRAGVAHILATAKPQEVGVGWECGGRPAESGMAHGVSGIVVALVRVSSLFSEDSRERSQLEAVLSEALRFERSLYSGDIDNWWPSAVERARCPCGWCRGAPGIAMARLELLKAGVGSQSLLREDLEMAVRSAMCSSLVPFDHVCCGNLSRAEAILDVYEYSGAPTDLTVARWVGFRTLRAAKTRGYFATTGEGGLEPSFFQGLSGIGYSFLRLARPEQFPSVVRFA